MKHDTTNPDLHWVPPPRFLAGDLVTTGDGKLYCVQGTHPLDAVGSYAYSVRGMNSNGLGYGPVRRIAQSRLRAAQRAADIKSRTITLTGLGGLKP
jgi:hypothetical protein